jgi:hypothetical protein
LEPESAGQGIIVPRRSLEDLRMFLVRQRWQQPQVQDIAAAVRENLARAGAAQRIRPGDEIAIAAGSRGIAAIPSVLRAVVDVVHERGGRPFIFPAMGSHGGGTAAGQRALLAELGISEETMRVPVRASMEVVLLGRTAGGLPVYLDAFAAQAAGIIVVNRVKKHTNFDGPLESGLCKMAVIGMGKHAAASAVHALGNRAFSANLRSAAEVVLQQANILAGLALLENAHGGLADIVGLGAGEIIEREPALLERAKGLSPKLPFSDIDLAVVERLGKDISGTGMDCYTIGRKRISGEPEWPDAPHIGSLIVLGLSPASHGNAVGVGLADFTTRHLVEQIDWPALRANVLTSGNIERGKLPLVYDTAREAVEAAAFRERGRALDALRVVALRDTLHLRYLLVSAPLAAEARSRADLEVVAGPLCLAYDEQGRWISPFPPEE